MHNPIINGNTIFININSLFFINSHLPLFNFTAKCGKSQYCILQYGNILLVIVMYIRIRNLREDSDITQAQMSKILNCSQQVYSNYELGQRDIPTDILIKLSKYYNVSIDYLLGLTNKKERNI